LACSGDFQTELAANFLGLDSEDPALGGLARDSLQELINMACGHLITALAGTHHTYRVAIPKVRPLEPGEWDDMLAWLHIYPFQVEGHPVLFGLRFSGEKGAVG
jgi:hypothetical protein